MYASSIVSSAVASADLRAFDIEVTPADDEYHEICDGIADLRGRVLKVIRHQIPAALYNGGQGYRVSWSVLARLESGQTVHYTVLNRDASRCDDYEMAQSPTAHGYFLRSSRACAARM